MMQPNKIFISIEIVEGMKASPQFNLPESNHFLVLMRNSLRI